MDRIYEVDKLLAERKIPIDVLIYTPQEIRERLKLGDLFVKEVIERGKLIYERKQ